MAKKKQNKEQMEVMNGKVETDIDKVKRLEKMLNIESMNPFGTNDPKIFEEKLQEYTTSDLQNLCIRVGIYPTHNKEEMRKKIKQEFSRFTLGGRSVSMPSTQGIANPDHPNHEKVKKMMKEGF